MYLQKVISTKNFVAVMKFTEENSRIRSRIRSRSSQRYGSAEPDPDPYQNVTDLQHCN
jgi:hypothetical protein